MKILFYGLNFKPEKVGIGKYSGEMIEWLSNKGHEIKVITSNPYFPEWETTKNYYSKEYDNNIEIIRCPIWVPKRPTTIRRIIHLISFSISSFPILISKIFWSPEIIINVVPSLFSTINTIILSKLSKRKIKKLIHIQDFELDAAYRLGFFKNKKIKLAAEKIEGLILKNFDKVSTISKEMLKKCREKGVNEKQLFYFPNWVDLNEIKPEKHNDREKNFFRKKLNISKEKIVILYAGSMNKKQDLNLIISSINLLKNEKNLFWLFVGEGPTKNLLIKNVNKEKNVKILPLQNKNYMNSLLNCGDIHIVPQVKGADTVLLPSKLLPIIASGKASIITSPENSELGNIAAKIGIRVDPGDVKNFCSAIKKLSKDYKLRESMGLQARELSFNYQKEYILKEFHDLLIAT